MSDKLESIVDLAKIGLIGVGGILGFKLYKELKNSNLFSNDGWFKKIAGFSPFASILNAVNDLALTIQNRVKNPKYNTGISGSVLSGNYVLSEELQTITDKIRAEQETGTYIDLRQPLGVYERGGIQSADILDKEIAKLGW